MTAKLKLPPGFYKNGTPYSGAGRYIDGDLIRWYNDVIQPVGGWQRRYDEAAHADVAPLWSDGAATEAVRSGIVLGNATNGVNTFLGSNKKIYMVTNSNAVSNVTPAGFVAHPKDATQSRGYGMYRYGFGKYGTPRPASAGRIPNVFSWGFAEWGFWPIACARESNATKLFIKKDTDADFIPIATSPAGAFDVVVTDERFVMIVGSPTDFRSVTWSDREDYEDWTPTVSNQAGSLRLAGIGKLVRIIKVLDQVLVLGENDAFAGKYVGPPYVYGFDRVGDNCGIIGPEAVAATDTFAVWIGSKSFWIFDGNVKQLPCEVLDFYIKDKSLAQRSKTVAFTSADHSEVWWLYQSNSSPTNEVDSYIVFNYLKNVWYTGRLDRTFGIDADPLYYSLMVSSNGALYDHEVEGAGFDGRVPFITSGPLETESGERVTAMSYVYPDEQADGDVMMELQCRDMPKDPVRHSMVYNLASVARGSPVSTTGIMGRDIRMRLFGSGNNPDWIIGDFRIDTVAGPRR